MRGKILLAIRAETVFRQSAISQITNVDCGARMKRDVERIMMRISSFRMFFPLAGANFQVAILHSDAILRDSAILNNAILDNAILDNAIYDVILHISARNVAILKMVMISVNITIGF